MLIKGEDKRSLLNEGKSADQVSVDFHQGSVTVLEFGSRPVKRARLLSDKDSSIKTDWFSSICTRGLPQGYFLEGSDGVVGGMPQRYQGDEPMSESNSGVTNEIRSRSAGLKVISCVHTSERMGKKRNTKVSSEQTSGARDDANINLFNHENVHGHAGSTKTLIQQDVDNTISTSDDHSYDGAASSQTAEKQGSYDNSETLLHCHGGGRVVGYCSHKSANSEDDEKAKLDAEEVDSSVEVSNTVLTGADSKLDTCGDTDDRLVSIPTTGLGTKNVYGSKYDLQVEESLRIRSDAQHMELADADEPISYGAKSLVFAEICTSLGGEVQSGRTVSLDHGDQSNQVIQKAPVVRVPDAGCGEETEVNLSEIPRHCLQTRNQSSTTQVATVGAAVLQENNDSLKSEDSLNRLHLEGEDPLCESIVEWDVRRPHSRANSHGPVDKTEKSSSEEPGMKSSEIPKVYVRTRKQSSTIQVATVGASVLQEYDGSSKSEVALNRLRVEDEDPLGESIIKHYVRRPHSRANSHGPADLTEKSSGLMMTSATNLSTCSLQAEHHTDMSARVETEGIINVFQRRSKSNPSQQDLRKNGNIALQEKASEKHSIEACYVRADHQPRWLPDGWTLEIRIREGKKTPARIRDKYYHDQKSGHRFRSRNEVLQFLEYERLRRGRMASDGIDTSVQLQDDKSLHLPIASAEHTGFQSSFSQSPPITQAVLGSLAAPSPSFTHLHPTRMKTIPVRPTSAVSTEANGTAMTRGHVDGPNGLIQLPWGPPGRAVATGTGQGDQGDKALKDAVASALDEGASNSSRILKSREGDRLPSGSRVPEVESPGDQGNKENRGKLILRLKRKQPDSDGGKGRSKRPTYEVVHVERTPPFTSTPNQQEKLTPREKTSQDVPSIPAEEPSSVKDISYEKPLITPPSMALEQPTSMKVGLGNATISNYWGIKQTPQHLSMALEQPTSMKVGLGNATISNYWGIKQTPQHLEVYQQGPYTALGIPANARTSGLQTMASYSANHTHVFLDPVENTIPLSWQYPFTNHAFTSITTSAPTFGPFPSVEYPAISATFSVATTVPIPVFEHFPGVSSSMQMNATTTPLLCSENRSRDSVSDVNLTDNGPQIPKALTAPRPLTKVENSELLLGLGRRLCKLAGLEHKTRGWSMQSKSLAASLEGKGLQQRV